MLKQMTFSSLAHVTKKKVTRREKFLVEMEAVVPWSRLLALIDPMRGFKTLRSVKATPKGIETIRTIKNNHIHHRKPGPRGEINHLHKLFGLAA